MATPRRDTVVLVIEDHALFAESLAVALGAEGYVVHRLPLAEAGESADRLLAAALRVNAHIVLLDLDLGRVGDGGSLITPLTRAGAQVVVVTGSADRPLWGGCLHQGARAVVAKHRPLPELLEVVRRLERREQVTAPEEYHELIALWRLELADAQDGKDRLATLTLREREVLGDLMGGHTIREIARLDVVSEATVRSQVRAILRKLRVSTQIAAVGLAHRVGWRAPPEHREPGRLGRRS
jgi:two-component system nitrate/nitrite response regulator NarL